VSSVPSFPAPTSIPAISRRRGKCDQRSVLTSSGSSAHPCRSHISQLAPLTYLIILKSHKVLRGTSWTIERTSEILGRLYFGPLSPAILMPKQEVGEAEEMDESHVPYLALCETSKKTHRPFGHPTPATPFAFLWPAPCHDCQLSLSALHLSCILVLFPPVSFSST
jgi:hypothetical protein